MSTSRFRQQFTLLQDNIEQFIRGKPDAVRLAITCLFAEGHVLIEDVPGVAKTSLARAIAGSIKDAEFSRVQFTPDLLPADITGGDVFNPGTNQFAFLPGPVFAHVLVGDEINRASPKTQSALLQAMAERAVTTGRTTRLLPSPFFCVATQNPVDHQGTYVLPEAQLDRFMMRLSIGYPGRDHEVEVVSQGIAGNAVDAVDGVLTREEIADLVTVARGVEVRRSLKEYAVDIAAATRATPTVRLGVSPRGTVALVRAAQVVAASVGRDFATPDDMKSVAIPVLEHRLHLTQDATVQGHTPERVLQEALGAVSVPRR